MTKNRFYFGAGKVQVYGQLIHMVGIGLYNGHITMKRSPDPLQTTQYIMVMYAPIWRVKLLTC